MKKPKKKKLPFYAKVGGGLARGRPDRLARGGAVKKKATVEPLSPTEPNAPAAGAVRQQPLRKGGVVKRQGGGTLRPGDDDPTTVSIKGLPSPSGIGGISDVGAPASAPAFSPGGVGDPSFNAGGGGGGAAVGVPPGPLPAPGMRRGGVVKRQDGGEIKKPIPDDWRELGPKPKPPPPREEPKPSWLENEFKKGQAIFGPKGRKSGGAVKRQDGGDVEKEPPPVPPPEDKGVLGKVRDFLKSKPSFAPDVPIRPGRQPVPGAGILRGPAPRYKDGGVLSAKQRQSLPRSDFALPGKGAGPKGAGSGSYPIPDRSHAQNALARSSGKPVAAQVRAKVKAKYPDMGK